MRRQSTLRRFGAVGAATALTVALLGAVTAPAPADSAPSDPATPVTVTADGLPTVQINGVVWDQEVVGNTVYAVGNFTQARPAGSPAGQNVVTRNYMLAFDIRTGALISSFNPNLNGQALAVTASPDGSRLYIGGSFTQVSGQNRYRIAAFDTATGALVPGFNTGTDSQVRALVATNDTVYAGGIFSRAGNESRTRLAAFAASNAAVRPWAPAADHRVNALTITPDGSRVVIGGHFGNVNGAQARGLAAVDPTSGATLGWPMNQVVKNTGDGAAILSLATDEDGVYGSGYDYYGSGGFEGTFRASSTGQITWLDDCHGDTYSVYPAKEAVYAAGHKHYCGNIGGFAQTEPWDFYQATALSKQATGVVSRDTMGYPSFHNNPSPTLLDWFPTIDVGSFTGQSQAAWSVTGNDDYMVYGGEFPKVNNVAQQGLVRFAKRSLAPNNVGPSASPSLTPTVTSKAPGTAQVSWQAATDPDSGSLTYRVYRNGNTTTPVYEVTQGSNFYHRPTLTFVDTGLTAGQTSTYRVRVTDPDNNVSWSGNGSTSVLGSGGTPYGPYARAVLGSKPTLYYRLDEASGTSVQDWGGTDNGTAGSGVTRGVSGAVSPGTASSLNGSTSGRINSNELRFAPNAFTIEGWFRTSSILGGRIAGFGSSKTGNSSTHDRLLYINGSGRVTFGVNPGEIRTVQSGNGYNDDTWHHFAASLDKSGMKLYLDGTMVGQRTDTQWGQAYLGYWRIGSDQLSSSWPNRGTSNNLSGRIDEVAVYPRALPAGEIAAHHLTGTTGEAQNLPPTASFTSSTDNLSASFDASGSSDPDGEIASYAWTFGDGTTATGASPQKTYASAGTYAVKLTVTDDDGATASVTQSVTVTAPPVNQAPTASFTSSTDNLSASFDASGSSDPDGEIASYAWTFGDGTTATGASPQKTYASAGTYAVKLTVTDDDGATGSVTRNVTVSLPPPDAVIAQDTFGRTATNGFGTADVGGSWSTTWLASNYSVADGVGRLQMHVAGGTSTAWLSSVSGTSTELTAEVRAEKVLTGSGIFAWFGVRGSVNDGYRVRLRLQPDGQVVVSPSRFVGAAESLLASTVAPGLSYQLGDVLKVKVQAVGTSPTTVRAKVWKTGEAEPASWTASATDSTAALQAAGGVGVSGYLGGSATNAPQALVYDNLLAKVID
ncbi:PKD domain-containing protein [Mumia sp. zg.B17]|uniref:PKD domain-containing protein n=2 Tax=unclassified Mumia TaxID=2621872 RepID=UPI002106C7AC|nr:PKD domain-containing protein [Mumia sp. zg.B17]